MRKILSYIFIFWLGTVSHLSAQISRQIDSLEFLLKKDLPPEKRIDVLNDLSYSYFDTDDSIALYYAETALHSAENINYKPGVKYAFTLVAIGNYSRGEYDKALAFCRRSRSIQADLSTDLQGYNIMMMGSCHRDLGNYDSALYYNQQAIEIMGDKASGYYLSAAYKNMATVLTILWRNNEALSYLNKAEKLARDKTTRGGKYVNLNILSAYGKVYENLLQFDKAEAAFSTMCEEAKQSNDKFHLARCHLNFAELLFMRGEFAQSLHYSFEALKITETYESKPLLASVLLKIGDVYEEYSQFDLATSYFFRALKITEKLKLRHETGELYSMLAWVYKEQGNFAVALEYIGKSETIRQAIKDKHGISNCYNIRGLIYYQQKKYDKAIAELEKSIALRKEIGHIEGVSSAIFNLSLVFADQNEIEKAIEYQLKGIEIEETIDNKQSVAISYNSISELYIKQRKFDLAELYLKKAKTIALQTKSRITLRNNFGFYAKFYEMKGDFKKAFESQRRYQELNDSIYSEGGAVKLAEMQALYQVEQKEQQIKLLNQDKQIQDDKLALQIAKIKEQGIIITAVISGIFLIALFALLIFRYNRTIKRSNFEILEQKEEIQAQSEELIEANQTIAQINRNLELKIEQRTDELKQAFKELDIFFYRSSHDFRRPLTTFLGLAEVAKITVKDVNALELFSKVKETASNLDKMLIKLQSISDVGANQLIYKPVFIKEIVDTVCDGFRDEIQNQGIRVLLEIEPSLTFDSYPALVKTILENLIENSIQFRGVQDPFIKIRAYTALDEINIEVIDNGQGIEAQYQDRIFEMYFRGNERSKGNGLGLYIVTKAVQKLSGNIAFDTEWGKGSTFKLRFHKG